MKTTIPMLIGTVLLLSACSTKKTTVSSETDQDTIPVKLLEVHQQKGPNLISASGQFTTEQETMLSFKTGGIIQRIFVEEGATVQAGQLLATIYLTEINAQVQQAAIAFEKAQRDFQRTNRLYHDSVATLEQLQNSQTASELSKRQLEAANFNLHYAEIRATKPGVILHKFASEGQLAGPGMPVFQMNAIQGTTPWVLKVHVSDKEWSQILAGDAAEVVTDVLPNQVIQGTVSGKSEGADPVTGTFFINISIPASFNKKLATGLFGKAQLRTSMPVSDVVIPFDAVLDGDAGEAWVFTANDQKKAVRKKITIRSIQNGSVRVSDGLQEGDLLITTGNAYLNDQSPIRIIR